MITRRNCLFVQFLLLGIVLCEGVSFPGRQSYDYPKSYTTQMNGINWQSQSFTITTPWQLQIHGRLLNSIVVNSTGALIFQYQNSNQMP